MKLILRRNFLILMLGITGVALIMPALHNISAYAEDNDGGSGGDNDSAGHDANDDNGSSGDDNSAGDDDDGPNVTGAVGAVFDPSTGSKPTTCVVGTIGCKAKK